METEDYKNCSVGEIVSQNFSTANIFKKYGIDFCCHGDIALEQACKNSNVDIDAVIDDLKNVKGGKNIEFENWPLDLLIDYVLKIHHRGIRKNGPEILSILEKVNNVHGDNHPELHEVLSIYMESLTDLENHLQKEENVLFPYLDELFTAAYTKTPIEEMHCGTVANPIRVMKLEHEVEGDRYHAIAELTNNFTPPSDACNSYKLLLIRLEEFVNSLYEHIHIENNIIFPRAIEMEEKWTK